MPFALEVQNEEHITRLWDKVSAKSSNTPKEFGRTSLKTVEASQRHLGSETVVLDYGCGTGDLTVAIDRLVKSVHPVDFVARNDQDSKDDD